MRIEFHDKSLKAFHMSGKTKGISPKLAGRVAKCLECVSKASNATELPQSHLLKRGGTHGAVAMRVSGAWRLVFRLKDGVATEMSLCQYH